MTITITGHDVSTTAAAVTGKLSPGFFVSDAEERALRLIGGWLDEAARRSMEGEVVSAELSANFYAWLDDPRDRRAKGRALDIIMEGCMDDPNTIFNIHSY